MNNWLKDKMLNEARRAWKAGRTLGKTFGPFGKLWEVLSAIFSESPTGDPNEADLRDAIELMDEAGYQPGKVDTRRFEELQEVEPSWRVAKTRTIGAPSRPGDPNRNMPDTRSRNLILPEPFVMPTLSAPHIWNQSLDIISNMIQTPESSNVYAYTYDPHQAILYVQYKAPGTPTKYTPQVSTCTGDTYKMGHRQHTPGPMYAYGSRARPVPEEVFNEMKASTSKGEFVWQRLRVCGSLWAHQVPYTLVTPSMAGGVVYTPRKATRHGFRVRTVPTTGFGRRPVHRSTLPPTARP